MCEIHLCGFKYNVHQAKQLFKKMFGLMQTKHSERSRYPAVKLASIQMVLTRVNKAGWDRFDDDKIITFGSRT